MQSLKLIAIFGHNLSSLKILNGDILNMVYFHPHQYLEMLHTVWTCYSLGQYLSPTSPTLLFYIYNLFI